MAAGGTRGRGALSYGFVAAYAALALAFGVLPALYALYLAFTTGTGGFAGVDNFTRVLDDFRFAPAVAHVALYLAIWLAALVVLVSFLAVVVHAVRVRWLSRTLRLVFYLPGAVAGASSVLLWLFVLDPTASPVSGLLRLFGFHSFVQVIVPGNLPAIFAIIAFWTGAGGWVVIMYGALNTIGAEVIEAARIDGANAVQIAWHVQLPLLRKWISYMGIMSLAAGTQLFVEPQLLSQASNAVVPNDYSLNQLAYQYAFGHNDFNGAAAISLLLLVVALALSAVFVVRGGLFGTD
ncbi:sugar ABC transporter permease [Micromonospora sp. WMMD998]|uniref:carbohydrate ABC transporter permease n=1 Tax=Micromonospora sp. WMMD998 TaxID=3016092 RepID=UPI00249CD9E0|nr:sugar ABC transporter permease [Micromonospora sp. WMMD998]WFE39333.1 sugar ABC transporter permease [Micromonospora sp. WMMD998]